MRVMDKYTLSCFLCVLTSSFTAVLAVYAGGYPHFLQNGLECESCHDVSSALPRLLKEQSVQQDIDHSVANQLCWSCHNDVDAPAVLTHSSLQASDKYGNWTVECVVCHDPHLHRQILAYPNDYIAQGVVASISATTLQKTGAADWIPDAYQGLILFPNKNSLYSSYRIVGNSSDTLTVDGDLSTPQVDGSMDLSQVSAGNTFIIGYSKLIKSNVELGRITEYSSTILPLPDPTFPKSGSKLVKFIRPSGQNSFADGDALYDGICEVCHTQTNYHQNGGGGAVHSAGSNCLSCHKHRAGFMHGGGAGSGCELCHGHDPGYEYAPGEFSQGAGTVRSHSTHTENDSDDLKGPHIGCADCHDTANFPSFKSGTDGDGDGLYSLAETDVCDTCHSPGGAFDGLNDPVIGALRKWDSGIYEADGSALQAGNEKWCASCHDQDTAGGGVSLEAFESYTDDLDLQATWESVQDARPVYLEAAGGPDGSKCMRVRLNWTRTTDDYATVKRDFVPALDLSDAGAISFQIKMNNPARFTQLMVQVRKAGGGVCEATMPVDELPYGEWATVTFSRGSFDDQTWGSIDLIRLRLFEASPSSSWVEDVYFDDITAPRLTGPNVVRDNVTSGFYVTGHGTYLDCTWCHDPASDHIDGEQRSPLDYIKTQANPTGFRFYADADMGLQLPYNTYQAGPTGAFALCYKCHPEEDFLQNEPAEQLTTNFTDTDYVAVGPENLHLSHIGAPGSPLTPSAFHGTCVLCHNVHGEDNPAMTRQQMGNLIYFDGNGCEIERGADSNGNGIDDWRDPAVNLGGAQTEGVEAYAALCTVCHNVGVPPNPDCAGSNPYLGSSGLNGWYRRTYTEVPVGPVSQSHVTHLTDPKGPQLGVHGCNTCHDVSPLEDACVTCHSPGGAFDGVNSDGNGSVGAWDNWATGVYAEEGQTLQAGKEKWCAGCHDDQPAYSMAEMVTPVIVDDPGATFVCAWPWRNQEGGYYGTGYRYHVLGDGSCTATWTPDLAKAGEYKVYAWWQTRGDRASNAPYTVNYDGGSETVRMDQRRDWAQWNYLGTWPFAAGTTGSVVLSDDADLTVDADAVLFDGPGTYAPNVIGDNSSYGFYVSGHKIDCLNCHDASRKHIDHEHRTYAADEVTHQAINPYCDSYRLKDVDGRDCMVIPRPLRGAGTNPLMAWQDFALCFKCHDKYEVLSQTGSPDQTNFWNNDSSPANSHNLHLSVGSYHFDSDFDSGHGTYGSERNDSSETCTACHNVHGSPARAMIRHGELISSHASIDKVPSLNFSYLVPYSPPYATARWTPDLAAGTYGVYAWWVEYTNRATNARYTVSHSGGSTGVSVNQQTAGSQWNLLGTYDFSAGTSGYVELTNEGADGCVMADAIGWDSDLDGIPDIIVDNGDPAFSSVGDCMGGWTCATGVAEAQGSDHCYHAKPGPWPDSNATLEQSEGGRFSYGGAQTNMNGVCRACHSAVSYVRTPTHIYPRILMQKAEPDSVSSSGTDTVLLSAYVYSPDDTVSSVTVDLVPLDGNPAQTLYDDGTNGDLVAGDRTYTFQTSVPVSVGTGLKRLTITATDSAARVGTRDVELMVANSGWTVVDNWQADYRGYWASTTWGDIYAINSKYHASGTGADTATFTPVLTQSGDYKVYAWWTEYSNRATNAPYTINYSGGSDTVTVDQRVNGGRFVYLGTYHFNAQPGYASVIVDNQDASFAGDWGVSMYSFYYGTDQRYIQSTGTGSNTATFTPDLPQAGNYDLYAWWTSHSSRAQDVPYAVHYGGGAVDTVAVNQELGEGGWQYLGTYYFDAGTSGYVEISDNAEVDEYVIADAIKWRFSSSQQGVMLSDDANGYVMADAVLFEPQE